MLRAEGLAVPGGLVYKPLGKSAPDPSPLPVQQSRPELHSACVLPKGPPEDSLAFQPFSATHKTS